MLNFASRKAREIHSQDWYFRKYPSRKCYICLITPNVNVQKRIGDRDVSRIEYFLANTTAERVKNAYPFGKYSGGVKK